MTRVSTSLLNSVAPPWLWTSFIGGVLVLLLIDLFVFQRKPHKIHIKEALITSLVWIILALGFTLWFSTQFGKHPGTEFLTGYIIEKSLSLDNLFVIYMIFEAFQVPSKHQHRVLFYGILGAIIMRGTLIIVGAKLIQEFHWILYVFGFFLIITAIRFLRNSDTPIDFTENRVVKLISRLFPITHEIHGKSFFVLEDGKKKATRLFLVLILVEISDLIFAFDSIPAVFAVTADPFIAFASNILAILGLRALYFVIADSVVRIRYLKPGLAVVLAFIGTKMLLMEIWHVPSSVSLLVIIGILSTAAVSSWYMSRVNKTRL